VSRVSGRHNSGRSAVGGVWQGAKHGRSARTSVAAWRTQDRPNRSGCSRCAGRDDGRAERIGVAADLLHKRAYLNGVTCTDAAVCFAVGGSSTPKSMFTLIERLA
jgi:hypothetical protein